VAVSSGAFTNGGGMALPKSAQTLTYDADGNMSFDGVWNYQWDGENRLISMNMTNITGIQNSNRLKLDFAYDYLNRRVQKVVSAWNGSAFTMPVTNKFVYDGYNLLATIDLQSSLVQSFMWGQDLSGSLKKNGGVGGLLLVSVPGTNAFVCYDGNGNVTALVDAVKKVVGGVYEYTPFGELLRASGPIAKLNPFRLSTKFVDDETGLVYYGYRYYSPSQGRWIGREPSLDQIFLHLYLFCNNNPLRFIDPDGREAVDPNEILKLMEQAYDLSQKAKEAGDTVNAAKAAKHYEELKQLYDDLKYLQGGAEGAEGAEGGFVLVEGVGAVGLASGSAIGGWVIGRIADKTISWHGESLEDHLADFFEVYYTPDD